MRKRRQAVAARRARVDDVAAAILARTGPISSWKLQKLAYYCQAWHAVWDGRPLFDERIEAWADGPVCRALYENHRGRFTVRDWELGSADDLTKDEKETIAAVVASYGRLSGRQLSHLTHAEAPWRDARAGLLPGQRSNREITIDAMVEYYGGLDADESAEPVADVEVEDV